MEHSFQEVMRQASRMCKAARGCYACDADGVCVISTQPQCTSNISEAFEKVVMDWAKKNPELKYGTWVEWLKKMGVVEYIDEFPESAGYYRVTPKMFDPIPCDTAKKLGLEPKEG